MTDTIDFYFDFSSPYGYFASYRINGLAAEFGRRAVWRPIMLGPVFRETGNKPLIDQGPKGKYCVRDWARLGRFMDVPWRLPDRFPIATLAAARGFYWLDDRDGNLATKFAKACYHAYFGDGVDIAPAEAVADVAAGLGVDRAAFLDAVRSPDAKARLKDETTAALARGVIGSPFIVVDGEGFWGSDRLWMVRKWLQDGGW